MELKISVIIPVYNRKELVGRAIKSVIDQSERVHEIIVVDDGSSDESIETALQFKDVSKSNYIVASNSRKKGANGARNTGIVLSSGNWIMFLDSDDWWGHDKVKHIQQEIYVASSKVGAIFDSPKKGLLRILGRGYSYQEFLPFKNLLGGFSKATIRRSCVYGCGLLDENLSARQDMDLYLRIMNLSEISIVAADLTFQEKHGSDRLTRNIESRIKSIEYIMEKYPNLYYGRLRSCVQIHLAKLLVRSGFIREALRCLAQLHLNPRCLLQGLWFYILINRYSR